MYILDTSIYGVLAKKPTTESENEIFDSVNFIIDYAKKHTDKFYSTSIIVREIHDKEYPSWIMENLLRGFYSTNSTLIEFVYPEHVPKAQNIAWRYIQELKLDRIYLDDSLNYALASTAKLKYFVTENRRGILSEEKRDKLERCNKKFRLNYVEIVDSVKFKQTLV